ncbi:adenylate kinase isoenzyme 1 isoform X2 [Onthophagus taurus]|uniref:adenylate kinase isoenzyme 1 isoform X2 n=1 Tax=Onthophagus taurus TaxID=166361 RepID=UPI0039BE53EF
MNLRRKGDENQTDEEKIIVYTNMKDISNQTSIISVSSQPKIDVPIIWVLGGPGSGKGTQCERIVQKYGFVHLSSGDLLRDEVKSGSPRGKELTAIMESGALVPLEVVLELLKEAIYKNLSNAKGFLIDGYPREKEQGVLFEKTIGPVDVILFFDASTDTLVERLLSRGKTSGRVDDNEETIKKRLNTFVTHTDAIVNHYLDKLKKINAERAVDDIFGEVESYLDPLVTKA